MIPSGNQSWLAWKPSWNVAKTNRVLICFDVCFNGKMIEQNGRFSIAMSDYQRVSGRAKPSRSMKKLNMSSWDPRRRPSLHSVEPPVLSTVHSSKSDHLHAPPALRTMYSGTSPRWPSVPMDTWTVSQPPARSSAVYFKVANVACLGHNAGTSRNQYDLKGINYEKTIENPSYLMMSHLAW